MDITVKKVSLAAMTLVLVAGLPLRAREQRVWTARYPLPAQGRLTVDNVQGDIRVEGWDREEVELTVLKTGLGPASRLDDVRVAFDFGDRSLGVRTVYAGDSGDPVRVDYRLRVPRQTRLDRLRTVEGDITVREAQGSVNARTLYGNIEQVNVAGGVEASAVNGNIAVSMCKLPAAGNPLRLDTVNGNLSLVLPDKANADLELTTVSGKIEGSYVFLANTVPGDTTRRTRLGQGGVLVRLRTVRGNIQVVERKHSCS